MNMKYIGLSLQISTKTNICRRTVYMDDIYKPLLQYSEISRKRKRNMEHQGQCFTMCPGILLKSCSIHICVLHFEIGIHYIEYALKTTLQFIQYCCHQSSLKPLGDARIELSLVLDTLDLTYWEEQTGIFSVSAAPSKSLSSVTSTALSTCSQGWVFFTTLQI